MGDHRDIKKGVSIFVHGGIMVIPRTFKVSETPKYLEPVLVSWQFIAAGTKTDCNDRFSQKEFIVILIVNQMDVIASQTLVVPHKCFERTRHGCMWVDYFISCAHDTRSYEKNSLSNLIYD